jgi:hypothetical protein
LSYIQLANPPKFQQPISLLKAFIPKSSTMKELLEFVGAVLYLVFSIVTFPLVVVAHCLIEFLAALKFAKNHRKQWARAWKKRRQAYHLPRYIHTAVARIRSFHL